MSKIFPSAPAMVAPRVDTILLLNRSHLTLQNWAGLLTTYGKPRDKTLSSLKHIRPYPNHMGHPK